MLTNEQEKPFWTVETPTQEPVAEQVQELRREHLLLDPLPPAQVDEGVLRPLRKTSLGYWIVFAIFGGLTGMLFLTWLYQMINGLGITGINRPSMWGLYIVNFVYFVGIGHAGTFISAALRALKFEWRRPISRGAELVTVFGLATAGLFPLIHVGRTWKAYWMIPYPNQRQLWPDFHSPLVWDLMAITTYLTCSILFVWLGIIPDFAMARDRTTGWRHNFFKILSFGWRGTEREWHNHETAMNVFTYCIIPVMFSVHTVVSWDFAMAIQPGWHSTIFGPYFIIGALFSGVAAVIIALMILRKAFHWEYYLRTEHFNGLAMFLLILSMAWAYFYFNDYIVTWYGNMPVDKIIMNMWAKGSISPLWYIMLIANIPICWIFLGIKKLRTNFLLLLLVSVGVQIGMYIERYIIVPISLTKGELPYTWGSFIPYVPDTLITIGAFSQVIFLFILISKFIPIIPTWEVKEGQLIHGMKMIGNKVVQTKAELE